jgi:hypothetical protein
VIAAGFRLGGIATKRSLLHRSLYGDSTSSDASVSLLAPPRVARLVKGNTRRRSMKALAISIVA